MHVFLLGKPFSGCFSDVASLCLEPRLRPLEGPLMTRPNALTCDDCYFRRNGLCAMTPERPCPTFRAAARVLRPPRQPRLVPLTAVSSGAAA